jgi:hypothetical protein
VFSLARLEGVGCANPHNNKFLSTKLNDLDLRGNAEKASATSNAQFLFVHVSGLEV